MFRTSALTGLLLCSLMAAADPKTDFHRCLSDVEADTGIDRKLLLAIKITESGTGLKPPVRMNNNGTADIGIMQINTVWLPDLAEYGISRDMLMNNCVNLKTATWILSRHIRRAGDLWEAAGLYHSATPHLKERYMQKVKAVYRLIEEYQHEK